MRSLRHDHRRHEAHTPSAPHPYVPRDTFVPPGPFATMAGLNQGLTTAEVEMIATPATCAVCGKLREDALHLANEE